MSRQIKQNSSILDFSFLTCQEKTKQSIKGYLCPTRDSSQTINPINQSLRNYSNNSSGVNIISKDNTIINNNNQKNLEFYERAKEREILKQRKIDELRNIKLQNELNEMKKFKMNNHSKEIILKKEKRNLSQPNFLENKKIKEKDTLSLKKLIKEEEELKKNNVSNNKIFNEKSFKHFLMNNENMIKNKINKINERKKELEIIEYSSQYSFKPNLNKKSMWIIDNLDNITEEQKLIRSKSFIKKELLKINEQYSFKPKINNNKKYNQRKIYNNIINSRSDKNVNSFETFENKNNLDKKNEYYKKNNNEEILKNNKINIGHNHIIDFNSIKNSKIENSPFNSLYKLNIRQNLPNSSSENIIDISNNSTKLIIESFL